MPKCEDCEEPIVFLRKPEGGWLPPVEPILDFAYADCFTVTLDGTAQPVPQVYKKHECLTWEEKQLKRYQKDLEKRDLIEADRARRAEAARVQLEFEQAVEAKRLQDEADEREREEALRQERQEELERRRHAARVKKFEKDLRHHRVVAASKNPTARLKVIACSTCHAEVGEACRNPRYFGDMNHSPWLWWTTPCSSRFIEGPADDRSHIYMPHRWGEDYDEGTGQGTTPMTVGPWPPSRVDGGRYDMRNWLRENYLYVFEAEKVWLTQDEQATLTGWLAIYGDLFEEVTDGPGDVAERCGIAGAEGAGGGHAGREGSPEAEGDPVDLEGQADPRASDGEQEDRREPTEQGGTEWLRKMAR